MSYELVHEDAFGNKDVQAFANLDEVKDEIDRLDACLDEASVAQSYRIWRDIDSLMEILSENEENQ